MSHCKGIAAFAACFSLLAAPVAAAEQQAKPHHHRHFARAPHHCPVHRTVNGDLVDCQGWRLRDNATGWDNSCFKLDYLPSMFACSAKGRH